MAATIDPLLFTATAHAARGARSAVRPSEATFRRRRRVVSATLVFAIASVVITSGAFASNPTPEDQVVPRTVVAKSGDTLWDIARTLVPQGNVADLVSEMVRLNGARIEPGQIIRIP